MSSEEKILRAIEEYLGERTRRSRSAPRATGSATRAATAAAAAAAKDRNDDPEVRPGQRAKAANALGPASSTTREKADPALRKAATTADQDRS